MFISNSSGGNKYQIDRSVRFRSAATPYLSRTPATAGNRNTWTISFWCKRGTLGGTLGIIEGNAGAQDLTSLVFTADQIQLQDYSVANGYNLLWKTAGNFRDPSAWYHVVVVYNTTSITSAAAVKFYVNGAEVTSTFNGVTGSYLQGRNSYINATNVHRFGVYNGISNHFDGYMAEVNFIDGQALTPASFGEYSSVHGQWVAKPYLGTYGVNGFYLPFKNNSSTSTLGWDYRPSIDGQTLTGSNGAVLTTATKKYGTAALSLGAASNKFVLYGTGTGINVAGHNIYNKNFTLEFWYKCQASDFNFGSQDGVLSETNYIIGKGRANGVSAKAWGVHIRASGAIQFDEYSVGSNAVLTSTGVNILDNQWHHIAVTRSGNTTTLYFDGVSCATNASFNRDTDNTYGISIGGMWDYTNGNTITYYAGGTIDDVRMYSGVTKYTGNFTVPSDSLPVGFADPLWMYNVFAMPMDGTNGSSSLLMYTPNHWTNTNVSVATDVTCDSMLDVPLGGGGNERGNYCTLNPLNKSSTQPTFKDGNLYADTAPSTWQGMIGSIGVSSGKWYWELVSAGANSFIGIIGENGLPMASTLQSSTGTILYYDAAGDKRVDGGADTTYGSAYTTQTIGVALDFTANTITFYRDNVSQGALSLSLSTLNGKTVFPFVSKYNNGITANFGQRPFTYTPPTGFKALHTGNLPAPLIANPRRHFDVVTWAGTSATAAKTLTMGDPGLLWIKNRSNASYDNNLHDLLRGANNLLYSNNTLAEATDATQVASFDAGGFTLGASGQTNGSTFNYVGWSWKHGGAGVTNTAGSISAQVSANPSAGFSIVTYTSTRSTSGVDTIGHGLGVAPKLVISKSRNLAGVDSGAWFVWHSASGSTDNYLRLNTTAAVASVSGGGGGTMVAPTSSVFSAPYISGASITGNNYVAYCFSEIAGYSKFGSYTGNGSADGPFVYCGFRPRWVLYKNTSVAGNWVLLDSARSPENVSDEWLIPNQSLAEQAQVVADLTANGFKIRATAGADLNGSGNTYIFAAFAEAPFQSALAR